MVYEIRKLPKGANFTGCGEGTGLSNILSVASLGEIGLESLAAQELLSPLRTLAAVSAREGLVRLLW